MEKGTGDTSFHTLHQVQDEYRLRILPLRPYLKQFPLSLVTQGKLSSSALKYYLLQMWAVYWTYLTLPFVLRSYLSHSILIP